MTTTDYRHTHGRPIWGKGPEDEDPYPLEAHLLDSWITAGAVWDTWVRPGLRQRLADIISGGDQARARLLVQTAASLHDLGKANPVFQLQAADSRDLVWRQRQSEALEDAGLPGPTQAQAITVRTPGHPARRHEYLTGLILTGHTPEGISLTDHWLIQAVAGHHGRWHEGTHDQAEFTRRLMSDGWQDVAEQIAEDIVGWTGGDRNPAPVARHDAVTAIILVSGLVILADWTASLDKNVVAGKRLLDDGVALGPEWLGARTSQLAESVRQSIGWYTSPDDPHETVMRGKTSLRPLQDEAVRISDRQGLWIVAYPTGEGKTEASLLRHMGVSDEGVIFALPTRATTNAMQGRLQKVFADTGNRVILSHQFSARHVCVTAGADHGDQWYDSPVRRLVAPVVATTCDQVLSGALRGKWAALRLTALANHHIILDEVHTYDHYQTALLQSLLHWWGATDTRVTLLSATLPAWQQRELELAYRHGQPEDVPVLTYPGSRLVTSGEPTADSPGMLSSAQPDLGTSLVGTNDCVATHVGWVSRMRSQYPGAHLAVVVNTVDRAIAVAERVEKLGTGAHVICLHSRFTLSDRNAIERRLESLLGPDASQPQKPVVLVGTQVIEASLDIDVDFMSTDICPAPSLVQRSGRCRRFRDPAARTARLGGQVPQRVVQVVHDKKSSQLPYLTGEINRVAQALTSAPTIRIPDDVQQFVDGTVMDAAESHLFLHTPEGRQEIQEAAKRLDAADKALSPLRRAVSGKRARYRFLWELTSRDQGEMTEDVMGTRFIDRPSAMYLLVPPSDIRPMLKSTTACLDAIDSSVPVSGRIDDRLADLSTQTLAGEGITEWTPHHRGIRAMRPVDPARLGSAGLTYCNRLGLRKA